MEIPNPVFLHAARTGRERAFRVHPVKRRRRRFRSWRRERRRPEIPVLRPTRDRLLIIGDSFRVRVCFCCLTRLDQGKR
ncbi:MAG: hypothetical protein PHP43_06420, partial [Methanoculleus sp.]|nr:hypothetical protein [Methanoculleus sp.]